MKEVELTGFNSQIHRGRVKVIHGLNDRSGNDWKKGRGARTCLRKNVMEFILGHMMSFIFLSIGHPTRGEQEAEAGQSPEEES